jgi:hypothetical protein
LTQTRTGCSLHGGDVQLRRPLQFRAWRGGAAAVGTAGACERHWPQDRGDDMGRRTLPAPPRPTPSLLPYSFLLLSTLSSPVLLALPLHSPPYPRHTARNGFLVPLECSLRTPCGSLAYRSKPIASQPRPFTLTRAHASLWMVQIENPPPGFSVPGKVRCSAVRVPHGICGPTRSLRVP